ncbi:MAG TPA: hypothetical protein DCZ94_20805 [Lentisphaeria bacterium]|nr:MAG: hypothetical protein A2X48_09050 [Lentisphaerae bacterium GWF2_49_21]HBC89388.1 hypothetical protein [Lentisphaeria bacterium]
MKTLHKWEPEKGLKPSASLDSPILPDYLTTIMKLKFLSSIAIFAVICGTATAEEKKIEPEAVAAPLQDLNVVWARDTKVSGHVTAVFPHPSMTQRILLAVADGLMISENGGEEWKKIPAADLAKIGRITCMAFVPDRENSFYAGTDGKGVWLTEDCGKTFKQIGSVAKGMASDSIAAFYIFPGDQLFHTLVAAHGDAAPGISRSVNKGETWSSFATDYNVSSIRFRDPGCYDAFIVASKKDAPDIKSIFYGISIDDYWYEAMKDVVPSGNALPLFKHNPVFSTLDQGIVFVSKSDMYRAGPKDVGFTSVGVTWGRTADEQLMYSYDPKKMGMIASMDAFKTWTAQGAGLYTGDFTKEGSHVRANANGTVFYAMANNNLYVGRQKASGLTISSVRTTPSVFEYAGTMYRTRMTTLKQNISKFHQSRSAATASAVLKKDIDGMKDAMTAGQYSVTAQVSSQGGKAKSVTIDLRMIGGSQKTLMFDDGKHEDGKADDGIYGTTFRLDPWRLRNDEKIGPKRWPGQIGLTITADGTEGSRYAAVAPIDIYSMPEAFEFYRTRNNMNFQTEGNVSAITTVPAGEAHAIPEQCFKLEIKPGAWQATIGGGGLSDITGYYAISFWIKSSLDSPDDVLIQMRDSPMYMDPATTEAEGIADPAYIESGMVGSGWQRVVISLSAILSNSPDFRSTELGALIFSGNCTAPITYWISEITFHVNQNEIGNLKTSGVKKRKRR